MVDMQFPACDLQNEPAQNIQQYLAQQAAAI